ncbi:Vitamin B12 transporter BtuB [Thalassocella blandensis]|nr:Vitamin B12 transporter BtuB [Thalassocella blandensis]
MYSIYPAHRVKLLRAVKSFALIWTFLISSEVCARLEDEISIELPEQSLRKSLIALGRLGQISIVFSSQDILHKKAPAIKGTFTASEIIHRLLEEHSLSVVEINTRAVAIVKGNNTESKVIQQIKNDDHMLEELVILGRKVTGSRLRLPDLEGSAPMDIFTREEIDASGSQSLSEIFKYIPAVAGNSISTAVSNGGNGTASVTLRGLPSNNTLVLANGRRVAVESLTGRNVDVNTIPLSAIDRLEILKDGASAIYGTDAIAGVINIILKDQYDGFEIEQYAGTTYKGDLETYKTHVLLGTANEDNGIYVSAEYFDQGAIFSRDRNLSSDADGRELGGYNERSSATPKTRFTLGDNLAYTLIDDRDGSDVSDFEPAPNDYLYNYLSETSSTSPSEKFSLYSSAFMNFSNDVTLSANATYNETESFIYFAPTPIFTAFENIPLYIDATNIYNPYDFTIYDARRRVVELGTRTQKDTSKNMRLNLTLQGFMGDDTNWEIYAGWNKSEATESINNLANGARVQRALGPAVNCQGQAIDGCVPLNLFGQPGSITEEQLNYIRSEDKSEGMTTLKSLSGYISTTLAQLPAGPLTFATGIDIRQENIDTSPTDPDEQTTNIAGGIIGRIIGQREIYETYFESHFPVLYQHPLAYSLDLELAARWSEYSDFGQNTSPKAGIRYRPIADILLRSTYSEGFRAPSLSELHTEPYFSQSELVDPCAIESLYQDLPGCTQMADPNRLQFLVTISGNEELEPETSRNTTFGIVWTPDFLEELFVSVDHFNIRQENIAQASAQLIILDNALYNSYSEYIKRDENGNIVELYAPYINISQRDISGVDTTIRYKLLTFRHGSYTFSFNSTYLDKYEVSQPEDPNSKVNLEGTFMDIAEEGFGALPHWKANAGLFWHKDGWGLNYTVNYFGKVEEILEMRTIDAWITHDTQLSYDFGKKATAAFGIDNLLNESPPFIISAFNDNYDARNYDQRGRYFYGKIKLNF